MGETLYYLSDYADEVMPCQPTLESWAQWLAGPDPEWGRDEAARPGDTFEATTMVRHANITVRIGETGVEVLSQPPASADFFAVAPGFGGWDAECSGETPAQALGADSDLAQARDWYGDDPVELACCTQSSVPIRLRFDIQDGKPVLIVEGAVQ